MFEKEIEAELDREMEVAKKDFNLKKVSENTTAAVKNVELKQKISDELNAGDGTALAKRLQKEKEKFIAKHSINKKTGNAIDSFVAP